MIDHARIAFFSILMSCSLIAGVIVGDAWAQVRQPFILPALPKDTSKFWIFKDVTAGPYFTAGISRQNENLPQTWQSIPRFSYMFGGTIDFSYSKWLGLDLSLLYDARDLYLKDTTSDNIDLSLGYVSFQPSIRIYWLLIGFSFDIPMSGSAIETLASYHRADHPEINSYNENVNMQTSDLLSLTEIRATLSIPILETDNAYLHFLISGSYPLSKTIAGTTSFDTTGHTPTSGITSQYERFSGPATPGKGPLPTIQAGISYQFDLIH